MDDPIPAASLILMRSVDDAPLEVLVVVRGAMLAFAGGAHAFPGGRIDPADRDAAVGLPHLDRDDAAGRIAALRETFEETGIAVGFDPASNAAVAAGVAAVIAGQPPAIDALQPFARWIPGVDIPRRFDTRFYLADAPPGCEPVADGVETERLFWTTPRRLLDRLERGDGRALFPTRCLLARLAQSPDVASARAEARTLPDRIITPSVEQRGDGRWLTIPQDAGYPYREERIEAALRG